MSELETFRDHCRTMANWAAPERRITGQWCRDLSQTWPAEYAEELAPRHDLCTYERCACQCHPRPTGPSDADRALFARLADEVDAYLTTDADEGLFA